MPVAGVLLVGRPEWVEKTAGALLSLNPRGSTSSLANVTWPAVTTPAQALSIATGDSATEADPPLPHDLWPAVSWKRIDRRVAVSLVLSQFDRQLAPPFSLTQVASRPIVAPTTVTRTYGFRSLQSRIRSAILRTDSKSRFRKRGSVLEATASVAAHRAATELVIQAQSQSAAPNLANDQRRFSLKEPLTTSAENALRQFAQTAGRVCEIRPDAVDACKKPIRLEAESNTIRELIEKVAAAAGVKVGWTPDRIVVSAQ